MSLIFKRRDLGERGTLIVEFCLVTPIVLALFFGAIETSSVLKTYQALSSVSRELAKGIYKNCAVNPDPTSCDLNAVIADVDEYAIPMLSNHASVVTVFALDTMVSPAQVVIIDQRQSGTHTSRLQITATGDAIENTSGTGSLISLTPQNPVITVAEVFHDYSPKIGGQFLTPTFDQTLYEVTIY